MEVINSYIKYVYYLLTFIIIIVLNVLLHRSLKVANNADAIPAKVENINAGIEKTQSKIQTIIDSEENWVLASKTFVSLSVALDFFNIINRRKKKKKRKNSKKALNKDTIKAATDIIDLARAIL